MRIWKRINLSIDYFLRVGYVIMGHRNLYENLEKSDALVDIQVLLQVFGRLSSMLQTNQGLGAVLSSTIQFSLIILNRKTI